MKIFCFNSKFIFHSSFLFFIILPNVCFLSFSTSFQVSTLPLSKYLKSFKFFLVFHLKSVLFHPFSLTYQKKKNNYNLLLSFQNNP